MYIMMVKKIMRHNHRQLYVCAMLCECLLDTPRRGDSNDTSANYLLLNKNHRQISQICHISVVLTNTKIIFFFLKKKNLFVSSKFGVSLVNRCSRRDFAIFFPNFRIFLIFLLYHIIIFHRKNVSIYPLI